MTRGKKRPSQNAETTEVGEDAVALSRRERQIMDAVYNLGRGTAAQIREAIPDPPSYSAVRAQLRILEEKGHLDHVQEGPRYVYGPVVPKGEARESALRHLLRTFFGNSTKEAMVTLLDLDEELDGAQRRRLQELVEKAKEQGR